MKIKFKQGVYLMGLDISVNVGEEYEVEKEQAQSLIDADFAEEVIEVDEKKEPAKKAPRQPKASEKDGE